MLTSSITPNGYLEIPKRIRDKYGFTSGTRLVVEERQNALLVRPVNSTESETHASSLSEREMQVLELLADGLSYKLIADELNLSFYTVNAHCKHIYQKLDVSSSGEAVACYYKNEI